jgi:single-strand DNA-binding protein
MFTKLIRIGRDAEMKYLPSGTAILEFSGVYDIGYGDNKKAQWVKLAMFGERAQKLVSHFTKGTQIVATMDDVKSEAWIDKGNGEAKSGMSAKLVDFEFAGGGQPQQQPAQQPQQQYQAPPQQAQPQYQQPNQQQQQPQQQNQSWGTPPPQNQQQ